VRAARARTSEKNGALSLSRRREIRGAGASRCVYEEDDTWKLPRTGSILPGSPLPPAAVIYSNSIDTFFQCLIGKWLALSVPSRGLPACGITMAEWIELIFP